MYKVITTNGKAVEYARFCGGLCESVGFGTAGRFGYSQAHAIADLLRDNGYSVRIITVA